MNWSHKIFFNNSIIALLISALLLTFLPTHTAHGAFSVNVVGDISYNNILNNLRTNVYNTQYTKSIKENIQWLRDKEERKDPAQSRKTSRAVQELTSEMLAKNSSDKNGKPAFVYDPEGQLLQIDDTTYARFRLSENKKHTLSGLGQSTAFDTRTALEVYYFKTRDNAYAPKRTLPETANDNGAFSWDNFRELTTNFNNDPTFAYMDARDELERQLEYERGNELREWDWGQGFLSDKKEEQVSDADGTRTKTTIITPAIVRQKIATKFGVEVPVDLLITQDELGEETSEAQKQVTKELVSGTNGMLGLGGNAVLPNGDRTFGPGSNESFLEALAHAEVPLPDLDGVTTDHLGDAIDAQNIFIGLLNSILNTIDDIDDRITDEKAGDLTFCFDLDFPTLTDLNAELADLESTFTTFDYLDLSFTAAEIASGDALLTIETLRPTQMKSLYGDRHISALSYIAYLKIEHDTIISLAEGIRDALLLLQDGQRTATDEAAIKILADSFLELRDAGLIRTSDQNTELQVEFIIGELSPLILDVNDEVGDELDACGL